MEWSIENAAEKLLAYCDELPPYPHDRYDGRGIVIAAGGMRYNVNAYVNVRLLRHLGCELPIEIWRLRHEKDEHFERILKDYNVTFHCGEDAGGHSCLHGWELKPWAVLHSSFRHVLYLDADSFPIQDPAYVFDLKQYADYGAIFTPDYSRTSKEKLWWRVYNLRYVDEPEFESGQIFLDKSRCWQALNLTSYMCEWGTRFFWNFQLGDKDCWRAAWKMTGTPFWLIPYAIKSLPGTMQQHDPGGNPLFNHRNWAKFSLYNNTRIPEFEHEDLCLQYIEDMIAGLGTEGNALGDSRWRYTRHGLDQRELVLEPNGLIGNGAAACERFWQLKDGRLRIFNDDHEEMMSLTRDGNNWHGRWNKFEQCDVTLTPAGAVGKEASRCQKCSL